MRHLARFATLEIVQITLTIPDELVAQAQARGLVLDSYLPELLAEDLAADSLDRLAPAVEMTASFADTLTEQQRAAIEAMLEFAKKYGFTAGGLDLKSMVHEGHKY